MALATETPKENFRLSMLIYDTRFRSITIQVVVLVLFVAALSWLLNNTVQNLEAKGRTFDFGFLWQRAGYDIAQSLIPYTNDSNHGRAMFVGVINTLVLAFLGCILASVLGVLIGVLRLSKNWLIGRLMTVYVEVFRNVPLLLWILLSYVILSETMPSPRDFRVTDEMIAAGEAPAATMHLFDSVAITNRGLDLPAPLLTRPLGVLDLGFVRFNLSAVAFLVIVGASLFANSRLQARARRIQEATGVRPNTLWSGLAVIFGPALAFLIAFGFHLEYPELKGFNFVGGIQVAHSFTALLIALVLYTAAFIAEIVRSGILAISKGQSEAAFALGLQPGRTMNLIILPQALRVIIPPLISQYLNLTKNTSLGIAVSYLDLRGTLGGITLNQTGKELECMLLMMLIYLTISLIISTLMNVYNSSVQLKSR
jgi:general L-amino acid transport system permease protein